MKLTYIQRPRNALFCLGLWLTPKKFSFICIVLRRALVILQYSFLLFNALYLGVVWGDLEQVSEACYMVFTQATTCIKMTNFLLSHKKLMRLIEFMEDDIFASESNVHDKILSAMADRMWKIFLFFMTSGICNCVEWAIIPMVEQGGTRIFPFKIWMPVDPGTANLLEYWCGYVYQIVTLSFGAACYLTLDYFTSTLMMFVVAQLEILIEKLKEVQPVSSSLVLDLKLTEEIWKQNNRLLVDCVRRHQAILRYIQIVEDLFNVNIFVQVTSTVFIICIICLRITIEPPNTFHFYSTINYLLTMLTQLYLYSWCGSEITEQSQVLRDAFYQSAWYGQDSEFKKTLCITLEFMKRPLVFRSGYYIPLSRPTFVSILRCSYSYFAVLNQANNK